MIATFVLLALACAATAHPIVEKTCPYPNGTDVALHNYNCDGTQVMLINEANILTSDNLTMYPVDPRKPMFLDLTAVNNGVVYNDNKVKVKIYEYSSNWLTGDCGWNEIPTFGLLDGLDGCDYAKNCPLKTGILDLRLPLDLSKYAPIVNALAGNHAYKLEVHMFNNNPGSQKEEISCVVVQLRFLEK